MVTGKFIRGNDDLREVEDVRMRVFVEEQGFRAAEEMDAYDARAIHCLLYDGEGKPAATGRLYIDDDGYWRIGRVAVVRERRVLEQLRYAKYVSEETLILVEASLHTDFSYAEDLGFEVIREKKYKTNKHVFLRKK